MLNNSDIFNHPDIGYNCMVTPLVLKFVSVSYFVETTGTVHTYTCSKYNSKDVSKFV